MRIAVRRAAVTVAVVACAAGLWWMFSGQPAAAALVGNSNVVGGAAGIAALILTITTLWPGRARWQNSAILNDQLDMAAEYLKVETLRFWRAQAKERRITTPTPATVRWRWVGPEVASPPRHLDPALLLTDGVVTQLRNQLFHPLRGGTPERIVILGGPGAGKTTAMLLLLIDILRSRASGSDDPVPVWLTLGSWNPVTTSVRDWAAETLTRDYPGLTAEAYGGSAMPGELVRTSRVALFLDGLDEMAGALRSYALRRIDEESDGLRVVLTSRPDEYGTAVVAERLWGSAVVEVMAVDAKAASEFLLAEQPSQRRRDWKPVIERLQNAHDSAVALTLTSPLALSMARDVYASNDPRQLLDISAYPEPAVLMRHLLKQVLVVAYPEQADRERAIRWLTWLAQRMGTSRDLHWWDIPAWMAGSKEALNRTIGLVVGLVGGFVTGLWFGLMYGLAMGIEGILAWLVFELEVGLIFGVVGGFVGLLFTLVGGFARTNQPRAFSPRWPRRRDLGRFMSRLSGGLVFGLGVGLVSGYATLLDNFVAIVVVNGSVFGLVFALLDLWNRPVETLKMANAAQIYEADRARTIVFGLVFFIVFGSAFGLTLGLAGGFAPVLLLAFGIVLVGGFAFGLVGTSGPVIGMQVMGLVWLLRGRRLAPIPLLQTAAKKQILRQVGAVYQFRHAELQDLLADPAADLPITRMH